MFESASSDSALHASSKCSSRNIHHVSKFEHLRYSIFPSTRKVFRHHFDSEHPSFDHPSILKCSIHHAERISKFDSPTKSSCIFKDNLILNEAPLPAPHPLSHASKKPSCSSKKILRPTKTLHLSEHLGTSTSNKSTDAKHIKSSCKIKSSGTSCPACHLRSTSRSRCSTLPRLINGEQTLYFTPVILIFIILYQNSRCVIIVRRIC